MKAPATPIRLFGQRLTRVRRQLRLQRLTLPIGINLRTPVHRTSSRSSPSVFSSRRIPLFHHTPRLATSRAQYFVFSYAHGSRNYGTYPSEHRMIQDGLEQMKHDKWGWVIYRCTYKDDQAWERFKQRLIERTWKSLAESDAPELANSLEWTFVEDPALEGASRDLLRTRFKEWAANAYAREQPRAAPQDIPISRYSYFIQVDEEAMQEADFVNFVDANWKPENEQADLEMHPENSRDEDDCYEPIDGCTEEDVGWMKISPELLNVWFYDISESFPWDTWHTARMYRRPPDILYS